MSPRPEDPDATAPDQAPDEHETTVPYQEAPAGEADHTLSLARLLERHQIETRIGLDSQVTEEGKALLPSHLRGEDRYEMVQQLAKGGMGVVLKSIDNDLRRHVAMKVIVPEKRQQRETMIRFIEEAQITGQLEHPNIVPVHELGVDAHENLFYTMKLIQGHTLREILKGLREGRSEIVERYSLSRLLNIFLKVCDAVAFAHSKGVIHRDLKPQNIMIGNFGEVIVLDWGIAKILPPDHEEKRKLKNRGGHDRTRMAIHKAMARRKAALRRQKSSMGDRVARAVDSIRTDGSKETADTVAGQIMGSPGFMAPEQADGELDEIDQRTDIFSLGAILFKILTLHPHLEGDSVPDMIESLLSGRSESPLQLVRRKAKAAQPIALPHCPGERIPVALSEIAMKALERKPRNRYQEVKQLQEDILAYLGGYATSLEAVTPVRKCQLFVRRHKVATAVLLVTVALAVAAAVPIVKSILNLDRQLAAAEARASELSVERVTLLSELGDLRGPRKRAQDALRELSQLMENWQWHKADQQARRLVADESSATLLIPPAQLMHMAQLKLFHGDIETALILLPMLKGSELDQPSQKLIAALATAAGEPAVMPERTVDVIALYEKLHAIGTDETRLAAECFMAGAVRTRVAEKSLDAGTTEKDALGLVLAWLRRHSEHPESITLTTGEQGAGSLTITRSRPGRMGLKTLRWLPVAHLDLSGCPELDVSALREMPRLKTLRLAQCATGLEELRGLKLQQIGFDQVLPAREFWKRQDDEADDPEE